MTVQNKPNDKKSVVLVVGRSGAGKSTAIKTFEDLSFTAIDNLPVETVEAIVDFHLTVPDGKKKLALGTDIRDPDYAKKLLDTVARLKNKCNVSVLFLTADEDTIIQRFSTTRRKHPLLDEGGELVAAVRREGALLSPIEKAADCSFDTTTWSPHHLARNIESRFTASDQKRHLYVTIVSFGFMNGLLRPADSIYDVRFLKNPFYEPALKDRSGLEQDVAAYVLKDSLAQEFLQRLVDFNSFLLPHYHGEGKHYFRIGIGCTGGKHRSVAIAEELGKQLALKNIPNVLVSVVHRDVNISYRPNTNY